MAEMGSQAVGDISLSLMAVRRPSTPGSGLSGNGPLSAVRFICSAYPRVDLISNPQTTGLLPGRERVCRDFGGDTGVVRRSSKHDLRGNDAKIQELLDCMEPDLRLLEGTVSLLRSLSETSDAVEPVALEAIAHVAGETLERVNSAWRGACDALRGRRATKRTATPPINADLQR